MLTIASIDRYDTLNNPGDSEAAMSIYFTGCTKMCPGCHNTLLWDKSRGEKYQPRTILFTICSISAQTDITTVVLLGGEPLEQDREDLQILLDGLHRSNYKVWLYTGWEFEDIPDSIKCCLDTIKCGGYDETLKQNGFPASSNQRIFRNTNGIWQQITL